MSLVPLLGGWETMSQGLSGSISRRNVLKKSVITSGVLVATSVSGTALAEPGAGNGSLVDTISSNGHWDLNDGADFFRSDNPFSRDTVEGGEVSVTPERGGALIDVDVDPEEYGDAGFDLHVGTLGDIGAIDVESTGDPVAMNLWFDESGNGEFFAWEDERGNTDRLTGLDGDIAAFGGTIGTGTTTITRTNHDFSGKTMNEWESSLSAGNDTPTAVWVGLCCSGTLEATVNSVEVTPP